MKEFRHLRPNSSIHAPKRFTSPRKKSTGTNVAVAGGQGNSQNPIFVSPFDTNFEESFFEEDVLDIGADHDNAGEEGFYSEDSDGELDDELRRDFVDEESSLNSSSGSSGLRDKMGSANASIPGASPIKSFKK